MSALGPPPAGGDVNRGPSVQAVNSVMFTAVAITTFIRAYVRTKIVKSLGWDDYIIFAALVAHIPSVIFEALAVNNGIGRHVYYLELPELTTALKWAELNRLFFVLITWMTKISICLFIIRIPDNRTLTRFLSVVMVVFTTVNLTWVIVFLAQCRPIQGLWDPLLVGVCWSKNIEIVFDDVQGGFAVATDLILSLTPIVFLWKIQMAIRKKVLICCLMATGLIATACCCVRIDLAVVNGNETDATWVLVPDTIWSIMELDIAFIAANLPAIFPIFRVLRENIATSYYKLLSKKGKGSFRTEQPSKVSSFHPLHELPSNDPSVPRSTKKSMEDKVGGSEASSFNVDIEAVE